MLCICWNAQLNFGCCRYRVRRAEQASKRASVTPAETPNEGVEANSSSGSMDVATPSLSVPSTPGTMQDAAASKAPMAQSPANGISAMPVLIPIASANGTNIANPLHNTNGNINGHGNGNVSVVKKEPGGGVLTAAAVVKLET
jgi:hypothetical protein